MNECAGEAAPAFTWLKKAKMLVGVVMGFFTVALEQADSEARLPRAVLTPNLQLLPPALRWELWHRGPSCPQGAAEGTGGSWRHWGSRCSPERGSVGARGLQWGHRVPTWLGSRLKKPQANCRRRRMMKGNVAFVGLWLQSAGKGLSAWRKG